jgi:allantoinase
MKHYDSTQPYPRDLVGYGKDVPHARWPGGARVAVQFVLNYEEGGENCVLHGDAGSEQFLSEMFNPASYPERHISMEGIYEYGSRAGVWRILREFERRGLPLTVFGVGMALQRHPELTHAFVELGHEIACHGWRWIHYQNIDEATEREHMQLGMAAIEKLTGHRALGWYTGRDSPRTRRLVADYGGFEYDSDYYGDDLPFWMQVQKTDGTRGAATDCSLHAGLQRHALCPAAGLLARRPVLPVPEGHVRRAVRRGRPEWTQPPGHDEHWHALPPAGSPRAHHRIAALSGPHWRP